MRILVNGLSARLGGGQTYLLNLLRHAPKDWAIFLLCPASLDLTGLPPNVVRVEHTLQLDNPFRRAIWEAMHLGMLAKKLKADILFSPGGLLPGALPQKLKTIVTFQNMLPFDHAQRRRYPLGYRYVRDWLLERGLSSAMYRANMVIFISQFAQDFIETKLGRLQGKTVVIPHGIGQPFFSSEQASSLPSYVPEGPYFLYVSFIDYYKSQLEVVRAFAKVKAKTNARLLLAGAENPPYGALLRQEIARLNLRDSVILLGNVPHADLPMLYQHAEANLFASCTENCPNILLEMMASGRPALVSNHGPMPEFGGDTVSYFDPANAQELVEKWLSLLAYPGEANVLAVRAQERVSRMTWEETAQATWGAMERL